MPLDDNDQILDPTHADDTTVVAGIKPVEKPPEWEPSEDGNLVKHGDRSYIRKEALDEERGARQKLQGALSAIEPLMPEFEEFLKTKQEGRRATLSRATAGTDDEYSDDELSGFAISRGYYNAENKPDASRAKAELDIMSRIADRAAAKAIGPLSSLSQRDRATANTTNAMNHKFVDGEPIAEEKYLKAVFDALPEDARADTAITNIATLAAAGLEYLEQRKTGGVRRGQREPLFREGGSGRIGEQGESFNALDRAAAKARGKTPEQWAKLQKTVGGAGMGVGTVLEDI